MMKKFNILFLILFPFLVSAQSFTPTAIPLTTDFIRPDAGGHLWNNRDAPYGTIHIPVSGSPQESLDYYFRFSMTHFFTNEGSDSTIDWSFWRARWVEAINKRQGVRWRIMTLCNNCAVGFNKLVSYNGGQSAYPKFLHDLMQAESPKDWFSTQGDQDAWVPNWNSPQFHRWINKLSQQCRNYIDTASHNGYAFRDAMKIYDLGYYGSYSEQHSNTVVNSNISEYPTGTGPTTAGLTAIMNAQLSALGGNPHWKYVIPFNAFDCEWLGHTRNPIQYGRNILDHADSVSWINDHIGANESYDHDYLENNGRMGGGYNAKLMNRWRYSPTGGEPVGWGNPADRSAIPQYVTTYHMSWFGNGNLDHITNSFTTEANNVRLAARLAGYRLRITGGNVSTSGGLTITSNWLNEGNAPVYYNWRTEYLIKNGAGTIVSTSTSAFRPRYFQPSGAATPYTDSYSSPAIPAGTYGLYVRVRDTTGYRNPMPLAMTNRQSDGSYFLTNITLGAGPSNILPVANAGANQSITGTSVTLAGIGTDADGTIAGQQWTLLSGPNIPSIVSPNSASTSVTGLVAGTYLFDFTVTDNSGGTGSDQVQVNKSNPIPPTANAGVNQTITLPTSQVTVSGSGTDDIGIVSYAWTKVAGPATFTITSPSSASTTITGLIQGTYTFRLTVTDGSGLTGTDDMNVIVNPGNTAPVSNAGANQTITLPTSTVSLSGSLSSDDAGITAYLWTQVGGPITATIATPTTVGTNISGLSTAGLYIFRLRVEDVAGLSSIDDVQITVNAAPNGTPVANAGPNQSITLPTSSVTLTSAGSTDDVGIVTRLWTKVSGGAATITTPSGTTTTVTGLVAGAYQFRVRVTDAGGLFSQDEVDIIVNAAPNAAPISDAGANQSITLPTSSVTLSGSGSDDVGITAYLWTKVSGTGGTIVSSTSASTSVTGLTAGTYTFRLRVTDGGGLTATDDVSVVVNPAPNNAPVASAGTNQTITLPTTSATLTGSGTDDVSVSSYLWTKVSGTGGTIVSPTSSTTNITGLTQGNYTFRLTVTDGFGLTDTDDVNITVNAQSSGTRWWWFWRWFKRR